MREHLFFDHWYSEVCGIYFRFFRTSYDQKALILCQKGNLENPIMSDPKVHALGMGLKAKI